MIGDARAEMIANARMYSVGPETTALWRRLLSAIITAAGVRASVIDHAEPAPINELWRRDDLGAVFMCGLPFSRAVPQPPLIAAPVPSHPDFQGEPAYWSDFVARADSGIRSIEDAYGKRIALTVPESQSGCIAALSYFAERGPGLREAPLFAEVIAPAVTPLGALSAITSGAADLAPIDSYALRLLERYRPDLTSAVRIVGRTARTPIPLLVAAAPASDDLRCAFLQAHKHSDTLDLMGHLLLQRFIRPDPAAYDVLQDRAAAALEYWAAHRFAAVSHPAFEVLWGARGSQCRAPIDEPP